MFHSIVTTRNTIKKLSERINLKNKKTLNAALWKIKKEMGGKHSNLSLENGTERRDGWYCPQQNLVCVLSADTPQWEGKKTVLTNLTHVLKDLHLQEHHLLPNRTRL
jgi:hypothetical protein